MFAVLSMCKQSHLLYVKVCELQDNTAVVKQIKNNLKEKYVCVNFIVKTCVKQIWMFQLIFVTLR